MARKSGARVCVCPLQNITGEDHVPLIPKLCVLRSSSSPLQPGASSSIDSHATPGPEAPPSALRRVPLATSNFLLLVVMKYCPCYE